MNKDMLEIVKKASLGDKSALYKLIKKEQNNIYSMILYLKKDEADIMDLLQNVLIKLSKNIINLKNPLYYKTWLNQIILNTYYDYLRKNKNKPATINLSTDNNHIQNTFDIPDNNTNPQETILKSEINNLIKTSINNLPKHYKIPLTLRDIKGLSYREISDITKTSIGTIKSRISRARDIIQFEIEKYDKS